VLSHFSGGVSGEMHLTAQSSYKDFMSCFFIIFFFSVSPGFHALVSLSSAKNNWLLPIIHHKKIGV
jgi:hypothetical protein